jgi:murein DD-endopeptidase MepM/ murein hydrolase activator NlpD
MAFAGVMMSLHAMPASAELVREEVVEASLQSMSVPVLSTVPVSADRGEFTVSTFSLVQAPIPMTTTISSGFGYRSSPCGSCSSDHQGVDFTPGLGYPVASIADGVVSAVGNPSGSLGVFVVIDHVVNGTAVSSVYAHMQYGSLGVGLGDPVVRGQRLGSVGSTGSSTGNHLHFEIRPGGGDAINPFAWLLQHVNS